MRGKAYNYEDYHKEVNNILYKKCVQHNEFFPDENEWILCTSEYFYINDKNNIDGFHPECKKCTSRKALIWKKENPKQNKKNAKKYRNKPESKKNKRISEAKRRDEGKYLEWQRENTDKSKIAMEKRKVKKHLITEKEWRNCKQYFGNSCAYCGLPIEKHYMKYAGKLVKSDLHKEHVIDDGRNDLKNCIPSCKVCNTSKHETSFNNWYNKDNPVFNQERYHRIYMWIRYDYKKFIQRKKNKVHKQSA